MIALAVLTIMAVFVVAASLMALLINVSAILDGWALDTHRDAHLVGAVAAGFVALCGVGMVCAIWGL